jgi:hypothetical protein
MPTGIYDRKKAKLNKGLFKKGHRINKGVEKSEEHRKNLSIALKGRKSWAKGKHFSKEHRHNISISCIGRPSAFRGKHHSRISKEKLRQSHLGKKTSEETRKKLSLIHTGFRHSEKSKLMMSINQLGDKGHYWKGGKTNHSDGYIYINSPFHPHKGKDNYIFEHRLVMEKIIGRYLTKSEVVHHINGIKIDNRKENLMLCKNNIEHRKLHKKINHSFP